MLRRVVFPQPLGPTTTTNSPGLQSSVMFSIVAMPELPKRLLTAFRVSFPAAGGMGIFLAAMLENIQTLELLLGSRRSFRKPGDYTRFKQPVKVRGRVDELEAVRPLLHGRKGVGQGIVGEYGPAERVFHDGRRNSLAAERHEGIVELIGVLGWIIGQSLGPVMMDGENRFDRFRMIGEEFGGGDDDGEGKEMIGPKVFFLADEYRAGFIDEPCPPGFGHPGGVDESAGHQAALLAVANFLHVVGVRLS